MFRSNTPLVPSDADTSASVALEAPSVCDAPSSCDTPPAPGFGDLGLSQAALASVAAAGFTTPTPVQARAIPPALAGRDVIACAATGTGKTLAFVLPLLARLEGRRGTRALVLAPTRELVQQIAEAVTEFGRSRGVRCAYAVGGLAMGPQARALSEGREVIVATPGRLLDHLDRGNVRFGGIEVLVLDEADRMLDLGFKPQLSAILATLPAERQTMLYSATMGGEVADFARRCLRDPVRVEIARTGTVAANAEQRVFHVEQRAKPDLLLALLAKDEATTLVFTRTKHRAERLAKVLDHAGHRVARIHGDRSQLQRQAALDGFRTGRVRVLVATDVAARGLDVADIAHVVNFDLSLVAEDHVHRVGRTARAQATGLASSFCAPEETALLRAIERFTRTPIAPAGVPEGVAAAPIPLPEPPRAVGRAPRPGGHQRGGARGRPSSNGAPREGGYRSGYRGGYGGDRGPREGGGGYGGAPRFGGPRSSGGQHRDGQYRDGPRDGARGGDRGPGGPRDGARDGARDGVHRRLHNDGSPAVRGADAPREGGPSGGARPDSEARPSRPFRPFRAPRPGGGFGGARGGFGGGSSGGGYGGGGFRHGKSPRLRGARRPR